MPLTLELRRLTMTRERPRSMTSRWPSPTRDILRSSRPREDAQTNARSTTEVRTSGRSTEETQTAADTSGTAAEKPEQQTACLRPGLIGVNEAIEMRLWAKVKKEATSGSEALRQLRSCLLFASDRISVDFTSTTTRPSTRKSDLYCPIRSPSR